VLVGTAAINPHSKLEALLNVTLQYVAVSLACFERH